LLLHAAAILDDALFTAVGTRQDNAANAVMLAKQVYCLQQ
jgi:hypothetical protein